MHVPFCAHRCGYCDFVTVVGRHGEHGRYVEALLRELELERDVLADDVETVFIGGGTPTFLEPARARAAARRAAAGRGGDGRGEPRDRHARARGAASSLRRHARLARRAELRPALARRARARSVARRRPSRRSRPSRGRLRQRLARSHLRHPRADRRRARARPRRGARTRAGSPFVLRARGQAGDALHPCLRRRARAPGRRDGGLLRARRRAADRRGLPLVRDGELLPRRDAAAAATTGRSTTSRTGTAATTSASAWARSRRSRASAGGTAEASRDTSRRWKPGGPPREVELLDARDEQANV